EHALLMSRIRSSYLPPLCRLSVPFLRIPDQGPPCSAPPVPSGHLCSDTLQGLLRQCPHYLHILLLCPVLSFHYLPSIYPAFTVHRAKRSCRQLPMPLQ